MKNSGVKILNLIQDNVKHWEIIIKFAQFKYLLLSWGHDKLEVLCSENLD